MIRGLYTAANGMIYQRRKLDIISNNMANISTPGYKKDTAVVRPFRDELVMRIEKNKPNPLKKIGYINHGVYIERMDTSFVDGTLEESNELTHMAIQGEGFFTILTEDGVRYTRDGSFHIDANGFLVTAEGYPVAGRDGQAIEIGNRSFQVDRVGNIIIDGHIENQLQLVSFANPFALEKIGDNLYVSDPDNEIIEFQGELFQGYLETSNVDPTDEMVNLVVAARSYESSQRIIQMMDEILGKAVNEVGRV